jgi:hypothetical protein
MATQWQLMWWRFRKHKIAVAAAVLVLFAYVIVLFADFFAYANPRQSDAQLSLLAAATHPLLRRRSVSPPRLWLDRLP